MKGFGESRSLVVVKGILGRYCHSFCGSDENSMTHRWHLHGRIFNNRYGTDILGGQDKEEGPFVV